MKLCGNPAPDIGNLDVTMSELPMPILCPLCSYGLQSDVLGPINLFSRSIWINLIFVAIFWRHIHLIRYTKFILIYFAVRVVMLILVNWLAYHACDAMWSGYSCTLYASYINPFCISPMYIYFVNICCICVRSEESNTNQSIIITFVSYVCLNSCYSLFKLCNSTLI